MEEFPLSEVLNPRDVFCENTRLGLKCPACGFDYQHFTAPELRKGNDSGDAEWGGRGELITIPFWSECGSEWSLCLGFQKGHTYSFVRLTKSCAAIQQSGFVYFIEAVGLSKVKIGFSDDPAKRVNQLSTGSAVPLRLLAQMPGSLADEKELHRRFDHLRFDGEWFHATKELLVFIQQRHAELGAAPDPGRM